MTPVRFRSQTRTSAPDSTIEGDHMFHMPIYRAPDFSQALFTSAPDATLAPVEMDGVAPQGFHSTSVFPEYIKVDGAWLLARHGRMDASIVVAHDETGAPVLHVVENRNLRTGDLVVLGRTENAEEGIYVHADCFDDPCDETPEGMNDKFAFRQGRSRETSFARDYDRLYERMRYDRDHGKIVWVLGPAFAFDADARHAMQVLIENGFVDGIMAGNALATHDLEAATLHTALGQDIYTQQTQPNGHYNHLDVINRVRRAGSIEAFVREQNLDDGIIASSVRRGVPLVLAGSIRDDGPLPGVIGDAYAAQTAMREMVTDATTIICLATMLHTIATGNMTPSYTYGDDGQIRPVFFYTVDISEFVTNKLLDRGSVSATSFIANVQNFIVIVAKGLGLM